MTPTELKTLIMSDPQAKALAEAGAADVCAARCREIATKTIQPLAASVIQREASLIGAWGKIRLAAMSDAAPAELRAVCLTLIDWINQQWPIDFALPAVQVMMGGLVTAQFLTQDQCDAVVDLSKVAPSISGADITTAMLEG